MWTSVCRVGCKLWWPRVFQWDDLRILCGQALPATPDSIWWKWVQSCSVSSCFGSCFHRQKSNGAFHHSFIIPRVKLTVQLSKCPPDRQAQYHMHNLIPYFLPRSVPCLLLELEQCKRVIYPLLQVEPSAEYCAWVGLLLTHLIIKQ